MWCEWLKRPMQPLLEARGLQLTPLLQLPHLTMPGAAVCLHTTHIIPACAALLMVNVDDDKTTSQHAAH
jgi:hypothetical protein